MEDLFAPHFNDTETPSRRALLLSKRNRLIAARYYYWTEIARRRFDDVLQIISNEEFFVGERTVLDALHTNDDYLAELTRARPSSRKLSRQYPNFSWG